jgi:hypothetical protein
MDATAVDDIIERLDADSRALLLQRLAYDAKRAPSRVKQGKRSGSFGAELDCIWEAFRTVTGCRAEAKYTIISALGTKDSPDAFLDALQEVSDYITASCSRAITMQQRRAVAELGMECLSRYMRSWSHPVACTPRNMANRLAYLPTAVERDFPGYANARALDRIAVMPANA